MILSYARTDHMQYDTYHMQEKGLRATKFFFSTKFFFYQQILMIKLFGKDYSCTVVGKRFVSSSLFTKCYLFLRQL